jgi:hypothetical protein
MVTLSSGHGIDGQVWIMEFGLFRRVDSWEGQQYSDVTSLAAGICGGKSLVFAGDERGTLFARDVHRKHEHCPRQATAHRGSIDAVRLVHTAAGLFVLSGGQDGIVHIWDTELHKVCSIEAGRPVRELALAGTDRVVVGSDRGVITLRMSWDLIGSRRR